MLRLEVWSDKADSSWDFFIPGSYEAGESPEDCLRRTNPDISEFLIAWETDHPEADEGFDSLCEQAEDFGIFDTLDGIRHYLETGEHYNTAAELV